MAPTNKDDGADAGRTSPANTNDASLGTRYHTSGPQSSTLDILLSRLDGVKPGARPNEYTARCPVPNHSDETASLSVKLDGEKIFIHDFGGCTVETIVAALGLQLSDLFLGSPAPSRPGLSLTEYAEAKKLPIAFLASLGLAEFTLGGTKCIRIPYFDEHRNEIAVRFRLSLTGDTRFRWRKGDKVCPYGLWRLALAREQGYAIIVEGESDAMTLWHHGFPAIGLPGADSWQEAWASKFDGIPKIYVIREPDQGGCAMMKWLSRSSLRDRTWVVTL